MSSVEMIVPGHAGRITFRGFRDHVLVIFTALVASAGCGDSRPSPRQAELVVRAAIDTGDDRRLQLRTFQKTDGQVAELMGIRIYRMMFEGEAEFVTDALYSSGLAFSVTAHRITTAAYRPPTRRFSWDEFGSGMQGFRRAKRGDKLTLKGSVSFEQRESGWVSSELAFSSVTLDSSARSAGSAEASGGGKNRKGTDPRSPALDRSSEVGLSPSAGSQQDAQAPVRSADQATTRSRALAPLAGTWVNQGLSVEVRRPDAGSTQQLVVFGYIESATAELSWMARESGSSIRIPGAVTIRRTATDDTVLVRVSSGLTSAAGDSMWHSNGRWVKFGRPGPVGRP